MKLLRKSMLIPRSMRSCLAVFGKNSVQCSGLPNCPVSCSEKPESFMVFHWPGSFSLMRFAALSIGEPVQCHPCGKRTLNPFRRLYLANASVRMME